MKKSALLALALIAGCPAAAETRLDPLFGNGAVLQRDRPIRVTGRATAGETVTVALGPVQASTRAGADGRFEAMLPATPAGGPFTLTANTATATDVMIGDVFLCSGQSNMEMSVAQSQDGQSQAAGSADPRLRLFTVAKRAALVPERDLGENSGWQVSGPETVPDFSAACFYMAKTLRAAHPDVPIGAIHASWGGSRISTWMSDAALTKTGLGDLAALRALYAHDPQAAARRFGEAWGAWWRAGTGDRPGGEPWQATAALGWKPVPSIGFWEDWGDAELAKHDGMVWYRREVTLTAAQARQAATLAIGRVDEADQTWVNGKAVGASGNHQVERAYALTAGTLKTGRNLIVVNALDSYGKGGMIGPVEAMQLRFADGSHVPLGDGWNYAIERRRPVAPPRAPWEDVAGAGTIRNAMIAPLGRIGLKGVAWYQGESDVAIPGYAKRLTALMADWRDQFGAPDLSFAIVQLAGFGPTAGAAPAPSGWAELREEQRQAVAADRHAALAIAIDLGDPRDIHPGQKHEVGRRLARAMESLAYDATEPPSGPAIESATRSADGGVMLTFTGVTGALAPRGSTVAIGFELCGATQQSCRFALGRTEGSRVTLPGDAAPVTRVRYGWADTPSVNLFDGAGLPAGPFEIEIGDVR
jgi:sialate O-acetylesterase